MSFLVMDGDVSYIDADSIELKKEIPVGIYKTAFDKFRGTFLTKTEIKLSHGKIYGNSQKIADHIVESFKINSSDKNLGVLLSGGRGLGKTLTTRLVIEQLFEKYPIITISEYTPDLPDFLSHIKECVILMDEFEKFMGGNIRGNEAEDEQTKQETLLSILDGNTGNAGNLFLLTVNNVYKLDENLKSRPGRIRYHYRYESEAAEVVRGYCNDNLNDKSIIEDVVKVLGAAKYVSLDIITSFVDELNKFPNLKPLEVMDFFNIDTTDSRYKAIINVEINGHTIQYERTFRDYVSEEWFSISRACATKLKNAGKYDEVPDNINISLDSDFIPNFIYGKEALPVESVIVNYLNGEPEGLIVDDVHILSVIIEDPEFSSYSIKYNKDSF